jgi:hypothetical protein
LQVLLAHQVKMKRKEKENSISEFDRLFFTWTTSETINDLRGWRAYIEGLEDYLPIKEILEKINNLESYLIESSNWAFNTFYDKFKDIKAPFNIKEFVSRKKVDIKLSDNLAKHIQFVYHLSQYAAIRSLTPNLLTPGEIKEITKRLNSLVINDIISSGLDESTETSIFRTLTRKYSLGASTGEGLKKYEDDAYYPLVVRSLSGLVIRSMEVLSINELPDLVDTMEKSLKLHYHNLRNRTPSDDEDNKLWAFTMNQPFMIYATQRTIYAMIIYKDLLEKLTKIEPISSIQKPEDILRDELAKSIANNLLGPGIIKHLSDFAMSLTIQKTGQIEQNVSIIQGEPPWLTAIVEKWLNESISDFKNSNVVDFVEVSVTTLIDLWDFCKKNKPPDTNSQEDKRVTRYHKLNSNIFALKRIGPKLEKIFESKKWDDDVLKSLFFEYLFYGYIYGPDKEEKISIKKALEVKAMGLWEYLDTHREYQKQKRGG